MTLEDGNMLRVISTGSHRVGDEREGLLLHALCHCLHSQLFAKLFGELSLFLEDHLFLGNAGDDVLLGSDVFGR